MNVCNPPDKTSGDFFICLSLPVKKIPLAQGGDTKGITGKRDINNIMDYIFYSSNFVVKIPVFIL